MDLYVAIRATRVLRVLIVRWTSRLVRADSMVDAVAGQTQLVHSSKLQQSRVRRAMRGVTGGASFSFEWRMFKGERTLLIGVALYARGICARSQPCLLEFETTVRIVTVAALHHAFQHLVMKGLVEVGFYLVMTTNAELRLAGFQ